ncbi:MAG: hypothetical protein II309_06845 [Bacilli bacterium]|nr:hypothetical protein [Bacilli bacterium]
MSNGYAISNWQDAKTIYAKLAKLTSQPIYSVSDEELKRVLEHFETKCAKSKEITTEAKKYIPGGVQHNLAFNYPFPICVTKAEGAYLYDMDGNQYIDFLQAGGPTILGFCEIENEICKYTYFDGKTKIIGETKTLIDRDNYYYGGAIFNNNDVIYISDNKVYKNNKLLYESSKMIHRPILIKNNIYVLEGEYNSYTDFKTRIKRVN